MVRLGGVLNPKINWNQFRYVELNLFTTLSIFDSIPDYKRRPVFLVLTRLVPFVQNIDGKGQKFYLRHIWTVKSLSDPQSFTSHHNSKCQSNCTWLINPERIISLHYKYLMNFSMSFRSYHQPPIALNFSLWYLESLEMILIQVVLLLSQGRNIQVNNQLWRL